MALTCGICSTSCKKTESIMCTLCNTFQHYNCVIKQNPAMAQSMKDTIAKTKSGFSFGCQNCMNKTSTNTFESKFNALEKQLQDLTNFMKENITSQLSEIKTDLVKSLTHSKSFEMETASKLNKLENDNNNLRKQLNRPDIIVTGIPSENIETAELYQMAISIAQSCGVNLSEFDVNFCTWIRKKTAILIKLNNVLKRDTIMKNYRANYNLKLNQVINTTVESRVFLNDHYVPVVAKLHYICRQKVKNNEIKRYKVINSDPIKVKLVYKNDKEVEVKFIDLINGKTSTDNQHFESSAPSANDNIQNSGPRTRNAVAASQNLQSTIT